MAFGSEPLRVMASQQEIPHRFLVGVIDLMDGHAVHAVAGHRERYRAVQLLNQRSQPPDWLGRTTGNAIAVAQHYWQCGVRDFYVADLDRLRGGKGQWRELKQIATWLRDQAKSAKAQPQAHGQLETPCKLMLDVGFRPQDATGPCFQHLDNAVGLRRSISPSLLDLQYVIASESWLSIPGPEIPRVNELVASLAGSHALDRPCIAGLDFRAGRFLGSVSYEAWLELNRRAGVTDAIVLDLAAVGTKGGPQGIQLSEDVRSRMPTGQLYSGGGVRSTHDCLRFLRAGCDGCLVATALLDGRLGGHTASDSATM
ncbi:MAG: HisA/HisF-related TIM barrel protein [Planctomycetota bacterium]